MRVRWIHYGVVLSAAVACYCALGAVLGVIPAYVANGLGANPVWVGVGVGAPALTGVAARPTGGRLADRHGPRPVLLIGAAVMTVGVLPSFAPSLVGLIVSRLIVDIGEALMMSAAVLWLLRLAGPQRHALALGHIGVANYVGLTIGPLAAVAAGGSRHPAGVWVLAVALPVVAAAVSRAVPVPPLEDERHEPHDGALWRLTLRPGLGLLLVNVGYVSLLAFGPVLATTHDRGLATYVVPIFAGGVIVSRVAFGMVPDRIGAMPTLVVSAVVEGLGLIGFATVDTTAVSVIALIAAALGQGLAVPSLGALALRGVPPERRGAAAGAFFAYFDAGVGLGGPFSGALTHLFTAPVALATSGAAVMSAVPTAMSRRPSATQRGPGGD